MRKTICILLSISLLAIGLLAAGSVPAFAESRNGYRGGYHGHGGYYGHSGTGAGGFFAGLIGGAILGTIIANTQSQAYYAPPPPAYVPPTRVWVPGRHETRFEREWVPGHWVEGPRGEREAWVPGHYENVRVEVWVPGHWEERG